jgi:hypothetical protein
MEESRSEGTLKGNLSSGNGFPHQECTGRTLVFLANRFRFTVTALTGLGKGTIFKEAEETFTEQLCSLIG